MLNLLLKALAALALCVTPVTSTATTDPVESLSAEALIVEGPSELSTSDPLPGLNSVAAQFGAALGTTAAAPECDVMTVFNYTDCMVHMILFYDCDGDGKVDGGQDHFFPPAYDGGPSISWIDFHTDCDIVDVIMVSDCGFDVVVKDCQVFIF